MRIRDQAVSVTAASCAPHPGQAQRVGDEIAAAARVGADPHVVEHGLRAEQRQVLEGAADADLGDAMRRPVEQRAPLEQDVAAIGGVEPADAVEQRRLAGAVRPDEPEDLAGLDREGDAVERDNAAETQCDVADFEQRPGCDEGRRRRAGRRRGDVNHRRPSAATARAGRSSRLPPGVSLARRGRDPAERESRSQGYPPRQRLASEVDFRRQLRG